ncbi:MAG: hypothetical protein WCQ54_04020 [Clostridiaceae bacterium]
MKIIRFIFIAAVLSCCLIMISACKGKTDENSTPDKVKINNDSITVNEGSSEIKAGESLKWPGDLMIDIPEPKIKITAVLKDDSKGQCTVAFAELSNEDAKAYVAKLKSNGYSGGMELSDENSILFSGIDGKGSQACFAYNAATKEGTISYEPKASTESDNNTEKSGN